jgi:hypothetical protein
LREERRVDEGVEMSSSGELELTERAEIERRGLRIRIEVLDLEHIDRVKGRDFERLGLNHGFTI